MGVGTAMAIEDTQINKQTGACMDMNIHSLFYLLSNRSYMQAIIDSFSLNDHSFAFVCDLSTKTAYFSQNICELIPLSNPLKVDTWLSYIDKNDFVHVDSVLSKVRAGLLEIYGLTYRFRYEHLLFHVAQHGRAVFDEQGRPAFVIGMVTLLQNDNQDSFAIHRQLKQEIQSWIDDQQKGCLIIFGVDNMKRINILSGRLVGDIILSDLMNMIQEEESRIQSIYKINGDCFAFSLPGATKADVQSLYDRIKIRMVDRFTISAGAVEYGAYPIKEATILLEYAESALDNAKIKGKNQLCFFSSQYYEERLHQLELTEDVNTSIHNNFEGFSLVFQPQFQTEDYAIAGAEALLRYHSNKFGDISPQVLIPLIESTDQMYDLGSWILKQACLQAKCFQKFMPDFQVSINITYSQLMNISIQDDVLSIIHSSGIDPSTITFEVTESMELFDYPHINAIFAAWKAQGIHISIDDFGTGYSSLHRLREMDVDEIKIDRCFVTDIQKSVYNYRLISNIMELADSVQIRVVCEGVEIPEELQVLEDLHPQLLQGYFFSKPLTPNDLIHSFLEKDSNPFVHSDKTILANVVEIDQSTQDLPAIILRAENRYYVVSDIENYRIYYMNKAAMRLYGIKNYEGRKCHKVMYGLDTPCPFCNNKELRKDSFLQWEFKNPYCLRHLMSKAKLIKYNGRFVRLEVSNDITKKEVISKLNEQRVQFAKKITGYTEILTKTYDYRKTIDQTLASVCDFYKADRAYMFEPDPYIKHSWNNTSEYCADNVTPQKHNLQNVPADYIRRWEERFDRNESMIILNVESLKEEYQDEYETLHQQDIQRLIAVPIRDGNETIAFIGVDNPRYSIQDDTQIRVLASILLTRYVQERNERQHRHLLQESNQDLLETMGVGFWILHVDLQTHRHTMYTNQTMESLLSVSALASPESIYAHCIQHLHTDDIPTIKAHFAGLRQTMRPQEFDVSWISQEGKNMILHLLALCTENESNAFTIKGYCWDHQQMRKEIDR